MPYIKKEFDFKRLIDGIKKDYGDEVAEIEIIYECQFKNKMKTPGTKEYQFFNSPEASLRPNSKKPPPMAIRDGLRGGCVELMCLSAEADMEYDVFYQDINRLVHFLVKVFIVNVNDDRFLTKFSFHLFLLASILTHSQASIYSGWWRAFAGGKNDKSIPA